MYLDFSVSEQVYSVYNTFLFICIQVDFQTGLLWRCSLGVSLSLLARKLITPCVNTVAMLVLILIL